MRSLPVVGSAGAPFSVLARDVVEHHAQGERRAAAKVQRGVEPLDHDVALALVADRHDVDAGARPGAFVRPGLSASPTF